MQRSKLDEVYSLSGKMTAKEFMDRIPNGEKLFTNLNAAVTRYIDPYTGKVKDDYVIKRDKCPLCDSQDYSFLFVKDGFDHVLCKSCDMIYTLEVLDNSKCRHLEEGVEGDSYGEYKEKGLISELDRKKFEIVFDELNKHAEIHDIFDFDCQAGTFLDWAREKGYDIIGHEYHTPLRTIAQKKGHTVLNDNLETIKFDRQFDLMTSWDYLDHINNPRTVIDNLGKYLKKGGLMFFAINNRDSLSTKILHQHSPNFIGPHHSVHFGINQLKILMKGYELLHAESYVSELNQISNWMSFKNLQFGDAPLAFDLFDPKRIAELGLGIKLNAIFRKL